MNTTEHAAGPSPAADLVAPVEAIDALAIPLEPKINGFDSGARSIFKEPSLYLSIVIVFIASAVCFYKTPNLFYLSFGLLSAMTVAFHVLAERFIFRANEEHRVFDAPLEGIFVVAFGAILPGLSLFAYGIYSFFCAGHERLDILEQSAKLALFLVVPFFNFLVWSAVRKKYLMRPRLIGLMNGFAFGLSTAWSAIWLGTILGGLGNQSCKFGWMLLLCVAPFMLFASACLGFDLWHKTAANIRRVTSTFSLLGLILSIVFAFTPLSRALYVQSVLTNARQAVPEQQASSIVALRAVANEEDLRPSKFPVSGFALAQMLVPNRGLETGYEQDNDLYFKVTGKSIVSPTDSPSALVGAKIPGLSLAKSQMAGQVDATTLSSSVDWNLSFHNASPSAQEARCEIVLPKDAALSRVTLWVDGEAREAAFAGNTKVSAAYQSQTALSQQPLIVSMASPDKLLVQCYGVPASGGEMKIRLGFKLALATTDGKSCSLKLPQLGETNFIAARRQRINLLSSDALTVDAPGLTVKKNGSTYTLTGICNARGAGDIEEVVSIERRAPLTEVATLDWYSAKPRYIVQSIKAATKPAIKQLYIVIDSSAAMKPYAARLNEILAAVPARLKPVIRFAGTSKPVFIRARHFAGGQDNWPCLRETIELAAEREGGAVLWLHGVQPIAPKLEDSAVLDLVHPVALYDLPVEAGANSLLTALRSEDSSGLIHFETLAGHSPSNLRNLSVIWEKQPSGSEALTVSRSFTKDKPLCPIIADRLVSAQVTSLWAKEEVTTLIAHGQKEEAQMLASAYRLVTPVSSAIVLANARDYKACQLNPGAYKNSLSSAASAISELIAGANHATARGLVGAPVDPRYGQSNEVGQLADYGYDFLRDISRLVTAVSFLVSLFLAFAMLKGRKMRTLGVYLKAIGIVIVAPLIVHILGTFMINNYGGVGGGL